MRYKNIDKKEDGEKELEKQKKNSNSGRKERVEILKYF